MKSQLSCEGFYLDETQDPDAKGEWIAAAGSVAAYAKYKNHDQLARSELVKSGDAVQLSGKIHCDLFQQDKPLVPGVSLSIKFIRSKVGVAFTALNAAGLPKACIRNPRLFVRKYVPTSSYYDEMVKALISNPATYNFERVQMRQMTINQGQQFAEWPNLVTGQLPKVMLLTMVSSTALNGSHDTNPYYFAHNNLMSLSAEIDGKVYPTNGYNMDYAKRCHLTAYEGLLRVLEIFNDSQRELPFSRHTYPKGYCIYGFDFTPSGTSRGALTLIRHGNLNLSMKFSTALTSSLVVIAYIVYDATISINNSRQAIFDFQA